MRLADPLRKGRYVASCRESTPLLAAMNGHLQIWPWAVAVSDGDWVRFYIDDKLVWECNAHYAGANFSCRRIRGGKVSRRSS